MDSKVIYYYSLDAYLKQKYGEKIYKLSLNGGMTCPNRDGKISSGGCIFCSQGGSGEFASSHLLSITEQIEQAKQLIQKKHTGQHYIAYFQAYSNTYAPVSYLENLFTEAIRHPDIVGLSIATRPDCLPQEVLKLIDRLNRQKPIWIELGLQTIHNKTSSFINRGYDLSVFSQALSHLNALSIPVVVHVILGLPYESRQDILETVSYLNNCSIQGIKLQLLHILKGTRLAEIYQQNPFPILSKEEYVDLIINCLEYLRPDIVIHRLTGDGPKSLLIAPLWSLRKRDVLNSIYRELRLRNTYQGRMISCLQKH